MQAGIRAMLAEDVERPANCAVIAVAKKIVRELPEGARVSLAQFERLAAAEAAGIEQGRECERRLCTPAPP